MYFDGMYGLGDNIYQRAVVRALPGINYLRTPWPQLYADLPNIRCVRPATRLRTQAKNAARAWTWATPPASLAPRKADYVRHTGTMLEGLCAAYGVSLPAVTFDLPDMPPVMHPGRPYVVVRPATIRAEWRADARNPDPQALYAAALVARRAGYIVVSVADLQEGHEWLDGEPPPAQFVWHKGELSVEMLLGLVAGASAVIGGVGWMVPSAIAYKRPMLLLHGGWGAANGPHRIFDSRMDISRIHQVFPDNYCQCRDARHACDKHISNLDEILAKFFAGIAHKQPSDVAA